MTDAFEKYDKRNETPGPRELYMTDKGTTRDKKDRLDIEGTPIDHKDFSQMTEKVCKQQLLNEERRLDVIRAAKLRLKANK